MTWWVTFRHVVSFLFFQFFVLGVVLMWFHAGSLSLCCVESDGASKVRLYFAPTLRMFLMSEGIGLCMYLSHLYMDCRKMSCSGIIFGIFSEFDELVSAFAPWVCFLPGVEAFFDFLDDLWPRCCAIYVISYFGTQVSCSLSIPLYPYLIWDGCCGVCGE